MESKLPKLVKCSVSGIIAVNQSGSSISGGFWEYLSASEVRELGFNSDKTKNKGICDCKENEACSDC